MLPGQIAATDGQAIWSDYSALCRRAFSSFLEVSGHMPYKAEAKMTQQGAGYDMALLPLARMLSLIDSE